MKKITKKSIQHSSRVALNGAKYIFLLAICKAVLGYFTGVVVLIAGAIVSLAEVLSLFAAYMSLKISQRHADKNFRYGYYKTETFAAFITALLISFFGIEILFLSINRIITPSESQYQILAVFLIIISIIMSLNLRSKLQKAGKRINSLALINNAKDKKIGIIVEMAVIIGVGANYFRINYLEGIIGVMISFWTLRIGLMTAKESLFFLLDYFDDQKLIRKIRKTIKENSRIVRNVKSIRMRRSGTYIFGEAFLRINPYAQTKDIQNELKILKREIRKTSPYLKKFLLFVDIPNRIKMKIAVPVKSDEGLNSQIATSFSDTKAFIFVEVKNRKIIRYHGKKFNFKPTDISGIKKFLINEGINVIVNNDMHTLLFYELRRLHNIDVYPNFRNVKNVENAVKLFLIDT